MANCGEVKWIGVVDGISPPEASIKVRWRIVNFVLKPTPSGRTYWRKLDWFNFDTRVASRYKLEATFSNIFKDDE